MPRGHSEQVTSPRARSSRHKRQDDGTREVNRAWGTRRGPLPPSAVLGACREARTPLWSPPEPLSPVPPSARPIRPAPLPPSLAPHHLSELRTRSAGVRSAQEPPGPSTAGERGSDAAGPGPRCLLRREPLMRPSSQKPASPTGDTQLCLRPKPSVLRGQPPGGQGARGFGGHPAPGRGLLRGTWQLHWAAGECTLFPPPPSASDPPTRADRATRCPAAGTLCARLVTA